MSRWTVLWGLALVLGCGGESGNGLIPVSGTVKNADGSNVAFETGAVVFQSVDGGRGANGALEQDGSFQMMTFTPDDGVRPGEYKVVLQIWKNYRDQTLAIPELYGDATTTPLEATVDGDHTHFDFKVAK